MSAKITLATRTAKTKQLIPCIDLKMLISRKKLHTVFSLHKEKKYIKLPGFCNKKVSEVTRFFVCQQRIPNNTRWSNVRRWKQSIFYSKFSNTLNTWWRNFRTFHCARRTDGILLIRDSRKMCVYSPSN